MTIPYPNKSISVLSSILFDLLYHFCSVLSTCLQHCSFTHVRYYIQSSLLKNNEKTSDQNITGKALDEQLSITFIRPHDVCQKDCNVY